MSVLNHKYLDKDIWKKNNVDVPTYDIEHMRSITLKEPTWIHFGAGNIFRLYIAGLQDTLLRKHITDHGIIVGETFDKEIIENIYKVNDQLTLSVIMRNDGTFPLKIIASVADSYSCDSQSTDGYNKFVDYFRQEKLQMVSLTVTEKGYCIKNSKGEYLPEVKKAFLEGPGVSDNIMVNISSLLYERFCAGSLPIAIVSMDNCQANGKVLFESIASIAYNWEKNGVVVTGFTEYLENPCKVAFPWSMIDKITPRPSDKVKTMLEKCGFTGMEPICTSKNTHIAPFVNAEEAQYLVVEDSFPNGRPQLEMAGVIFTDRDTVSKVEAMKVTACLNPLHTALAVFGCMLGYSSIAEEMNNEQLVRLIKKIGYEEALPVVEDPKILNPVTFIDEVIKTRLPNENILDTPQRIATDTSQKIPIRFGNTICRYLSEGKDTDNLEGISIVLAGWMRYLLGKDDNGLTITLSPDPLLEELIPVINRAAQGDVSSMESILRRKDVFGVDLIDAGMGDKVKEIFNKMKAPNGIKKVLSEYMGETE